jgi:hypothetical protein
MPKLGVWGISNDWPVHKHYEESVNLVELNEMLKFFIINSTIYTI